MSCTFSYSDRNSETTEQSGLDDYPRASRVNGQSEIHLDLQSWMLELTTITKAYAKLVGDKDSAEKLLEQ
jgi:hypothetical protein